MKAAVLDQFGSVDVMQVRDVPKPAIGREQILVEVYATNINPIEWNKLMRLPFLHCYLRQFMTQWSC